MVSDTIPEAEKKQREVFERLTGAEKLRLAMAWSDTVRDIAWAGFCHRHPEVLGERLRVMFLRELHGIELPERSPRQSHE